MESVELWINKAKEFQPQDPVNSFIAAWMAFQFYCSVFAEKHKPDYLTWANNPLERIERRTKWLFLVHHVTFRNFFDRFRTSYQTSFEKRISLPVASPHHSRKVPYGVEGEYRLMDLDVEQLFLSIYQLRNNLFHQDEATGSETDPRLAALAENFMIPFLSELLDGCAV